MFSEPLCQLIEEILTYENVLRTLRIFGEDLGWLYRLGGSNCAGSKLPVLGYALPRLYLDSLASGTHTQGLTASTLDCVRKVA